MAAWRVRAHIAEPAIETDQQPSGLSGGGDYLRVGRAGELLVSDGVNIMACVAKNLAGRRSRQVLIEFDFHRAGVSGTSSSRASNAP